MSIQGNIKPLRSLTEPLQVAKDNGAKRALIPIENKRNAVHARVVHAERRRSRKRGGETQRPRRSLSEAAVKTCGVVFPRPRMNGSKPSALMSKVERYNCSDLQNKCRYTSDHTRLALTLCSARSRPIPDGPGPQSVQ